MYNPAVFRAPNIQPTVELMSEVACRVCGDREGNRLHRAREMFEGTRDEFDYVECASCGTLHIREVPDQRPYYAGDYYSLRPSRCHEMKLSRSHLIVVKA